jgi:hypothetical protein
MGVHERASMNDPEGRRPERARPSKTRDCAGFSLIELVVASAVLMILALVLADLLTMAGDRISDAAAEIVAPSDRLALSLLSSDLRRATYVASSPSWSSDELRLRHGNLAVTYRWVDDQLLRGVARGSEEARYSVVLPAIRRWQWRTHSRAVELSWTRSTRAPNLRGYRPADRLAPTTVRIARRNLQRSSW